MARERWALHTSSRRYQKDKATSITNFSMRKTATEMEEKQDPKQTLITYWHFSNIKPMGEPTKIWNGPLLKNSNSPVVWLSLTHYWPTNTHIRSKTNLWQKLGTTFPSKKSPGWFIYLILFSVYLRGSSICLGNRLRITAFTMFMDILLLPAYYLNKNLKLFSATLFSSWHLSE